MPAINDQVAWDNLDGTKAGVVFGLGATHAAIQRFDGKLCSVPYGIIRPAVYEDIEAYLETV